MQFITGKDRVAFMDLVRVSANSGARAIQWEARYDEAYEEIVRLRGEVARERQRAENATDALLSLHGITPISPQPPMAPSGDFNPLAEDQEEAERIEKRMLEFGPAAVFEGMKT